METNGVNNTSEEVVRLEVLQKTRSMVDREDIERSVREFIAKKEKLTKGVVLKECDLSQCEILHRHVDSIRICTDDAAETISRESAQIDVHVYRVYDDDVDPDSVEINVDEDETSVAHQWNLPSRAFEGLWESLEFDSAIKRNSFNIVATALRFSDRGVDPMTIGMNKVLLLHGPPGTGKTSLCRALAHKLSIRFSRRYPRSKLVEVNSHSLFSKYFSESGKLVFKAFDKIVDLVKEADCLVCVLIDEVESLVHARKAAMSGAEPSDSVRVVNAVLTQLDRLRTYPNAFVLSSSNVTAAIDFAFVDRADLKLYIGPPPAKVIHRIYASCVEELMRTGLVAPPEKVFEWERLEMRGFTGTDITGNSVKLAQLAEKSVGFSGRTLRKIAVLAYARHPYERNVSFSRFLVSLELAINQNKKDCEELTKE